MLFDVPAYSPRNVAHDRLLGLLWDERRCEACPHHVRLMVSHSLLGVSSGLLSPQISSPNPGRDSVCVCVGGDQGGVNDNKGLIRLPKLQLL